jgi:probable HAF family extracellular repeat protein
LRATALALVTLLLSFEVAADPPLARAELIILPDSFTGFGISPDGSAVLGHDADVSGGALWRDGRILALERDPERRLFAFAAASSHRAGVVSEVGFVRGANVWRRQRRIALATDGEARGVSANGRVVVGFVDDPVYGKVGMRWIDEVAHPIPGPVGFEPLWAHAVSADGSAIFGAATFASGPVTRFLWREGDVIGIAGLPYATGSFTQLSPHGITSMRVSGDGTTVAHVDVVGDSRCQSGCGVVYEAWRWRDGGIEGLGVARPGDSGSQPRGISANGQVIAGSSWGPADGETAFLWDRAHGMRVLAELLESLGADLRGFELEAVWGMSDDGRRLMGPAHPADRPNADFTWLAILPPACADRVDNDGDGRVDHEDAGCRSRRDGREDR